MATPKTSVIDHEEARTILDPWIPTLRDDFYDAWDWVQAILNQDPDRRATLDSSTVSSMVYDRYTRLIVPRFDGKPGIRIRRTGRMVRIRIGEKVSLRFKRFNRNLRSGNIKTRSQKAIYFNAPGLVDIRDRATSVTFGYVASLNTYVRGLYVTCPKNFRENHWMIVIDDQAGGVSLMGGGDPAPAAPTFPTPQITPAIKPGKTEDE